MKPHTCLDKIGLNLKWQNLLTLLEAIQVAWKSSGRIKTIFAWGENLEICQNLWQMWQEVAQKHKENQTINNLETSDNGKVTKLNNLNSNIIWKNNFSDINNKSYIAEIPIVDGVGIAASLVAISSHFHIWIQVNDYQKEVNYKKSQEKSSELLSNINSAIADTSKDLSITVSLLFDAQAIADLLKIPAVAAAVPHCCDLQADELHNDEIILRDLWSNLLHLMQLNPTWELVDLESSKFNIIDIKSQLNEYKNNQTEKALLIPEDYLMQTAPIGIVYQGLDGSIIKANPAFCHIIGYTEKQLRHLDTKVISHPEDFADELNIIQEIIAGKAKQKKLRKRYFCRNGTIIWTESTINLVENVDIEDSYLITFVTDLSDRAIAEQEIQNRRFREAILSEILTQIRATLDLSTILKITVQRLRQALNTHRVIAYKFNPDYSGVCICEDVDISYPSIIGQEFSSECIPPPYIEAYYNGRLWTISDTHSKSLSDCHQKMLDQLKVRSAIAVAITTQEKKQINPITATENLSISTHNNADYPDKLDNNWSKLSNNSPANTKLWGLLVIHHCHSPRQWTEDEKQLVQALANQMGVAINQATLVNQLQVYTQQLEKRVKERTISLEISLKYEQLSHYLTETLRKTQDENMVLKAAVEGLGYTLNLASCYGGIFEQPAARLTIRYEYTPQNVNLSLIGETFPFPESPEKILAYLQTGEIYVYNNSLENLTADTAKVLAESQTIAPHSSLPSSQILPACQIIVPILDNQELRGALCVFKYQPHLFRNEEINLLKQVANQCSIAMHQAELYRQEQEARLSAEYFRSFLEQSNDVFVEYDQELRYLSINLAGAELLGRSPGEIIGKTNRELIGINAETIEILIQQAFNSGEKVFANHEIISANGMRTFETIYTPIREPQGNIHRVIGIGRDVTEIRQQWQMLQAQNRQLAEINRLKEEFIATTSHELRTPLTAILGFSSVLLEETFGSLNQKQKDYIDRIHNSGEHLLDLINDILDLSRIEADRLELEPQLIFLNDICENVISLLQERALHQGLKLEVDVEPGLEYMVADPRRLKQMLLNLLTNAVKFTTQGAVGLKIYHCVNTEHIKFEVWDTGIGISGSDRQRIFSPFSQIDSSLSRKYQGTGLGLAITRKLAELHGGSIELESTPGQGSRFTISLPLNRRSLSSMNLLESSDLCRQQSQHKF